MIPIRRSIDRRIFSQPIHETRELFSRFVIWYKNAGCVTLLSPTRARDDSFEEVINMKLTIGENIKRLRRARDMTQEELAEQLGVSFQSVSRWEKNVCYPDLELLPALADFFEVSADELLGLDTAREEAEIQAVLDDFQQSISRGDIDACISIARAGLKTHPGSYALMNKLMYALFVAGDDSGNIPDWKENMEKYDAEITQLGERIIKHCPDQ